MAIASSASTLSIRTRASCGVRDQALANMATWDSALASESTRRVARGHSALHVCNWCVKETLANRAIACAENPRCGRETDPAIAAFGEGKAAVVVGGGPAGMTASLLLAQAGYAVDLYEQRAALGGNLIASATPPGKEKLFWYHKFLLRRFALSRVRVWLNTRLTRRSSCSGSRTS